MRKFLITLFLGISSIALAQNSSPEASIATENYSQNIEKKIVTIDLQNAFHASPIIYSILLGLSIAALSIALAAYFELNKRLAIPSSVLEKAKEKIVVCRYDEALNTLENQTEAIATMLYSAIESRKLGPVTMRESIKQTGKRQTLGCWQKISLLSDIALLAPMIGLLGTVLGMFYAFYDVNRSIESLASLFDGLGVSVGTTVAGLIVALFSMFCQTLLKHRLISRSAKVETACESLTHYIGQS